jgi:hypothetical protein
MSIRLDQQVTIRSGATIIPADEGRIKHLSESQIGKVLQIDPQRNYGVLIYIDECTTGWFSPKDIIPLEETMSVFVVEVGSRVRIEPGRCFRDCKGVINKLAQPMVGEVMAMSQLDPMFNVEVSDGRGSLWFDRRDIEPAAKQKVEQGEYKTGDRVRVKGVPPIEGEIGEILACNSGGKFYTVKVGRDTHGLPPVNLEPVESQVEPPQFKVGDRVYSTCAFRSGEEGTVVRISKGLTPVVRFDSDGVIFSIPPSRIARILDVPLKGPPPSPKRHEEKKQEAIREALDKKPDRWSSYVFELEDGRQFESPTPPGWGPKKDVFHFDRWSPQIFVDWGPVHLEFKSIGRRLKYEFAAEIQQCWLKDMGPFLRDGRAHLVAMKTWEKENDAPET